MSARSKLLFLLLVTIQAAHSVEEYWSRLYDVLAPAKYVSGLVSADRAVGFIIINVVILMLGACCYAFPIRSGLRTGRIVAWLWLAIEFVNGAGHVLLAASAGAYFPGALTGATLVVAALGLAASRLLDSPGPAQGPKMVQRF